MKNRQNLSANNSKALSEEKTPSGIINKSKGLFSARNKLAAILVAILILGLVGWRTFGNRNQQPQYQTAQVEKGTIVSSVSASGQVLTANMVNVSTSASGVVKEVYVKDGEQVSAGSKILEVTLDQAGQAASAQAYNSYLSAKTTLDAANANAYSLRSTKDTAWKKFYDLAISSEYQNSDGSPRQDKRNSSAEFQSAEADWLAAEAKRKNQQAVIIQVQQAVSSSWLSYQKTSPTVTAPIAGTVSNITMVSGMVLSAQGSGDADTGGGQRVAVVKNDGNSIVSVNLSEVDVPKVEINDKATITIDAISDKTFTGKVVSVDNIGTTSSGVTTYPALILFDTQSLDILPNMAASASVIVETKNNVLLVPSTAVQAQNGQSTVQVMRKDQVISVSVEVGDSNDTQTEIISGISEGDTIVTGQTNATTPGSSTGATSPFGNTGGFGGGGGTQIPRR